MNAVNGSEKNTDGKVTVRVEIDENGKVILAKAVSGQPLLKKAAEKAALGITLSPLLKNGKSVKESRDVIFDFAPSNINNWFNLGMLLVALEKMPTLRYFEATFISSQIPSAWDSEQKSVERIEELKNIELKSDNGLKPAERVIDKQVTKNPDGSVLNVTTTAVTVSPEKKASSEAAALAQSLIASIRGRLGTTPVNLWYFDLGINYNLALDKADSHNESERLKALKPFQEFIKNPQVETSKESLDELQKMAALMEKGVFTDNDKILMSESLTKLNMIISRQ